MKKSIVLFVVSIILLIASVKPLFNILQESWIDHKINERYEIHHAYQDEQGLEDIIEVQEIAIDGMSIKIKEEETDKKASITPWDIDENVPPGDIVKIHLLLNDKEISNPDEIWLSNRHRGSRYFSWLDIVTIYDRVTGEKQISIVQRLTDDDHPMESRKWKIISISHDGVVKEKHLAYSERSDNKLGVKLINLSGTSLMSMGYHSDITKGYPSIVFPFLYPVFTGISGVILLIVSLLLFVKRRGFCLQG